MMNATESDTTVDVFTGVASTYEDLYAMLLFCLIMFLLGDVFCKRCLKVVPPLVGYILTGILLGPEGFDLVPVPKAWVLLGNLGLVLLMVQAGLEMDLAILQQVGARGFVMAIVGSILPISIGMFLSKFVLRQSGNTVIAMGCCFGPTSVGIALQVLGPCAVLETPLGQLIVAAAIVDDLIALLMLSQLEALTGNITVTQIVVPIVSAFLWLFVGGAVALWVVPVIRKWMWHQIPSLQDENNNTVLLMTLLGLVFALLPATYYSQASYLLGAFLAGLSFCQESIQKVYRQQFQRLLTWLMKFFFAATIGFQVPLSEFQNGRVLRNGCLLYLSLVGKLAVGPIFTPCWEGRRWRGNHLRDCAVVGFSMAGEAEFAFLVAVFGVTEQLIPPDLYASVVLAILLSTILSPVMLRTLLAVYPMTPKMGQDSSNGEHKSIQSERKESEDTG
ncbi:hypothetical protein FisN_5Lu154 [Fistulifera solaris]|uniref:Cation/H+ exchanger transmembrane domain-containing protein n=1 Tax=Fistulifera solaris TaxID=1519565 RepID=A0A1Z5JJI9_FISSO|nr:hypothetical protein FisN_5Lu154 [Fistulifera solaris]|eukprot:GAX13958.1 hypothetical protein FisN_5Lu154 [Fistulifera solaris]